MTNPEIARFALAFLGTYALHSTLLLAAVWALCASRPSLAPRLRERLWRLGLVGGLLTACAQLLLGTQPILGGIVLRPQTPAVAQDPTPRPPAPAAHREIPVEPARTGAPAPERARDAGFRPSARPQRIRSMPVRAEKPVELVSDSVDGARGELIQPALGPADPGVFLGARTSDATPRRAVPPSREEPRPAFWAELFVRAERIAERIPWPALVSASWASAGGAPLLGMFASWSFFRRRLLGPRLGLSRPSLESRDRERHRRRTRRRADLALRVARRVRDVHGLFAHRLFPVAGRDSRRAVTVRKGRAQGVRLAERHGRESSQEIHHAAPASCRYARRRVAPMRRTSRSAQP